MTDFILEATNRLLSNATENNTTNIGDNTNPTEIGTLIIGILAATGTLITAFVGVAVYRNTVSPLNFERKLARELGLRYQPNSALANSLELIAILLHDNHNTLVGELPDASITHIRRLINQEVNKQEPTSSTESRTAWHRLFDNHATLTKQYIIGKETEIAEHIANHLHPKQTELTVQGVQVEVAEAAIL